MRDINKIVVANIRSYRKHKKLTQKELAEQTGISRSYLANLEAGRKHSMSLKTLDSLSKKLDVPIETLIKEGE